MTSAFLLPGRVPELKGYRVFVEVTLCKQGHLDECVVILTSTLMVKATEELLEKFKTKRDLLMAIK